MRNLSIIVIAALNIAAAFAQRSQNFNAEWKIGDKSVTLPRAWNEEYAFKVPIEKMGDDGFKYRKGNPDIYSLLQQYGREDLAKRFAKQLRALHTGTNYAMHKPCTMVDKLVEELEHPESLLE